MIGDGTQSPRRLVEWGVVLAIVGLVPLRAVLGPPHLVGDWMTFYAAGALAGTRALIDPSAFLAYLHAHGLKPSTFPYPPAFAYLYAPLAHLSILGSFAVNAIVMLGCAVAAGIVGSRIFPISMPLAILASLAWAPIGASITIGQNAALGLLLAMLAIGGLATERPILAAVPIGLALYKPTYALPLIGLLVIRRRWRELGIVAVVATLWYALSVLATAGDFAWPVQYAQMITAYYHADFLLNAFHTVSLPGTLERFGVSPIVAVAAALILLVCALPGLARCSAREAGAAACVIGLAVSPHAYAYDAAMALPMLLYGGAVSEPLRTRATASIYVLAAIPYPFARFSIETEIVLALALVWVWMRSLRSPDRQAAAR